MNSEMGWEGLGRISAKATRKEKGTRYDWRMRTVNHMDTSKCNTGRAEDESTAQLLTCAN